MAKLQCEHYRYLSWTKPSQQEYAILVEHHFPTNPDATEKARFISAWNRYLKFFPEHQFRDPFFLGKLTPDIFAFAGFFSMMILIILRNKNGWLFRIPIVIHIIFYCYQYMGGIRYSYPVIPMHIIATAIMLAIFIRCRIEPGTNTITGKAAK